MIIKNHPTADVVFTVQILRCDSVGANFWIYSQGRDGLGGSRRHERTWEQLNQMGFDYQIEGDGSSGKVTLRLDRYFASTPVPHEIIEGPKDTPHVDLGDHSPCFFLRRSPGDKLAGQADE